jgi:serine/threonine protein kinase
MGDVHLARRDGAERPCVLKLLRVEHRSNASLLSRLKREAHVLSYLDHPHVARILDAGVEDGVFYLALEHIAGQTLRSIMKKCELRGRPMPVGAALSIALAVLDGVSHAHDLRGPDGEPLDLVHRDLAPSNIMVGAGGEVKIIDFGLAFAKVDRFRTTPGVVLGTFRYSAPEQVEGGSVDRRSDLYTVAAVLYEALSGAPVIGTRDPKEVLQAVVSARPKPFREIAPELPDALWEVIAAALSKDPRERPQDARTFSERLRAAARELPIFAPELLGQTVAALFSPDDDTAATWSSGQETRSVEATASEAISETASVTMELQNPEPPPRRIPWAYAVVLCAAMVPLSFAAIRALLLQQDPIVIHAHDDQAGFERRMRSMLSAGRYHDAGDEMSVRAEEHLPERDALEIVRKIHDVTMAEDWDELETILTRQLELETR